MSGWRDSNPRLQHPKCRVLANCTTPRKLVSLSQDYQLPNVRLYGRIVSRKQPILWGWVDSNHQSQRERIYSPCGYQLPVTTPFVEAEGLEPSRAYSWPIYYTRHVYHATSTISSHSDILSTWLDSNQRNEVLQTPALDHSTTGAFLFVLKPLQDSNLCFFASRNVAS